MAAKEHGEWEQESSQCFHVELSVVRDYRSIAREEELFHGKKTSGGIFHRGGIIFVSAEIGTSQNVSAARPFAPRSKVSWLHTISFR